MQIFADEIDTQDLTNEQINLEDDQVVNKQNCPAPLVTCINGCSSNDGACHRACLAANLACQGGGSVEM